MTPATKSNRVWGASQRERTAAGGLRFADVGHSGQHGIVDLRLCLVSGKLNVGGITGTVEQGRVEQSETRRGDRVIEHGVEIAVSRGVRLLSWSLTLESPSRAFQARRAISISRGVRLKGVGLGATLGGIVNLMRIGLVNMRYQSLLRRWTNVC